MKVRITFCNQVPVQGRVPVDSVLGVVEAHWSEVPDPTSLRHVGGFLSQGLNFPGWQHIVITLVEP